MIHISTSLPPRPLAVRLSKILFNLVLKPLVAAFLKLSEQLCGRSDKLVAEGFVVGFFAVGQQFPPPIFVDKILETELDNLPFFEHARLAFLAVNLLAVLLSQRLAIRTVERILRLCKIVISAQFAPQTENFSARQKARIFAEKSRNPRIIELN